MFKSAYQARLIVTLIVMVVCAPLVIFGGRMAMQNMSTSPSRWVPANFHQRQQYDSFEQSFETNDTVVISWDGCTIDDPRLGELRSALLDTSDAQHGEQLERWVERVYTGESLVQEMTDDPLRLREETARRRLYGALIGVFEMEVKSVDEQATADSAIVAGKVKRGAITPGEAVTLRTRAVDIDATVAAVQDSRGKQQERAAQGQRVRLVLSGIRPDEVETGDIVEGMKKTTCCVVLLSRKGVFERQDAIPLVLEVAAKATGVPQQQLHVVGPPVDAYTIDKESVASMRVFVLPSALITLVLCRFFLRSWPYTFLVFGIAVFGEMLALALVYYSGETMNAVLIVLPPLVMVLTVSAAVHLVNYYHDEVRRTGPEGAPRKAMANGMLPCGLATATTAIGLLSLLLSDIIPVKLFGIYATAGIVTTLVLLFLTLPGAQERWPVLAHEGRESIFKDLSGLSGFVCRYPSIIAVLGISAMIACGWGLQWTRTSVNVRALFTEDSRILNDYRWFENNIGPMVPVEVVLHFHPQQQLDELERLEIVDDIHEHVEEIEGVDGSLSAATFFATFPRGFAGRRAAAIRLGQSMDKFDEINYLAQDAPQESWRISGRVAAMGRIDYGQFLAEIQQQIDPRLWAYHHLQAIEQNFRGRSRDELAQAKLLLVGTSLEDALAAPAAQADADEEGPRQFDQTRIFVQELVKLLTDEGFSRENIASSRSMGEAEDAGDYDGIVLVDNVSREEAKRLAKQDTFLLDARRHTVADIAEDETDQRLVTATYTGVMPLAYEVQRALLNDLMKSFASAVLLVTVVMIFLQRSAMAGLVSMIPNVFPMVVLFGITSWRRVPIDIGTVMTASVALGIAVDDTLHFLTWFNRENSETGDRRQAVKLAFRHCAKAMFQTTLICGLGLVIYSFSWFMPTRRFSWMMVTLLLAALVGDLVLLPAILASPVGRLFPRRKIVGDPLAKQGAAAQADTTKAAPQPTS